MWPHNSAGALYLQAVSVTIPAYIRFSDMTKSSQEKSQILALQFTKAARFHCPVCGKIILSPSAIKPRTFCSHVLYADINWLNTGNKVYLAPLLRRMIGDLTSSARDSLIYYGCLEKFLVETNSLHWNTVAVSCQDAQGQYDYLIKISSAFKKYKYQPKTA